MLRAMRGLTPDKDLESLRFQQLRLWALQQKKLHPRQQRSLIVFVRSYLNLKLLSLNQESLEGRIQSP